MTNCKKLELEANKWLAQYGFNKQGTPRSTKNPSQEFFEKRIIRTPMGNGMK